MPRKKQFGPMKLSAAIIEFLGSPKFKGFAANSQRNFRKPLEYAMMDEIGSYPLKEVRRGDIQTFLDAFADRPYLMHNGKKALQTFQKWALRRELIEHPFVVEIELPKMDGAYEPWTDEQVSLAVNKACPEMARAVLLAYCTGQRGSDLVRMQWTHIDRSPEGWLRIDVTQKKTKLPLYVPVMPELETAMAIWPRSLGYILTKANGEPYTRSQLTWAWNHERDTNQALAPLKAAGLVMHGLRATAVIRLRRANLEPGLVGAVIGMSRQTVDRYCRKAERWLNTIAAMKQMGYVPNNVIPLKLSVDKSEQTGNLQPKQDGNKGIQVPR